MEQEKSPTSSKKCLKGQKNPNQEEKLLEEACQKAGPLEKMCSTSFTKRNHLLKKTRINFFAKRNIKKTKRKRHLVTKKVEKIPNVFEGYNFLSICIILRRKKNSNVTLSLTQLFSKKQETSFQVSPVITKTNLVSLKFGVSVL